MLKKVILDVCEKYGRKPSIDELWHYFESDQDRRGIIHDCTDEKVTWETSKGEIKDTTRKTVQNMLSTITYPEVKS